MCYVLKAMTFPADYPTMTETNYSTPYYVLFYRVRYVRLLVLAVFVVSRVADILITVT
jgi:hypothetical protein